MTYTNIYAKHEPYTDGHIAEVLDVMRHTGPPTIHCVEFENKLFALNGSHRLYAAQVLKMPIKIVVFDPDTDNVLTEFWQHVMLSRPVYELEAWRLDAFSLLEGPP